MKPDFTPWLCSWPDSSKQGQGFPRRFWSKYSQQYRRDPLLHVFCGSSTEGEVRIDIRPDSSATHIGDFRTIPLPTSHFRSALADPPYTQEFADTWNVKCPTPAEIQRVVYPALQPGGLLAILHLQVIRPYYGFRAIAYHPVFCGTTKHIRCLTVLQKPTDT